MAQSTALQAKLTAVDNISPVLKNITFQSKVARKALLNISQHAERLISSIGKLGIFGGAAGIGGFAVGANGIIGVTAQFEKFRTVLETVEGSSFKAQASMDWVKKFAKTTPYDVAEVTGAFVKLRNYGIDPTKGALASIGDAAAALGQPLDMGVEALSDAMTNQYERLKLMGGIVARQMGNKVAFLWNENGKQFGMKADSNNQVMIGETIQAIWNRRYSGAMKKLNDTWEGVTSGLRDHWTNFLNLIGESGSFDYAKKQMISLRTTLDDMDKSGALKEIAGKISILLIGLLKRFELWMKNFDPNEFLNNLDLMIERIGSLTKFVSSNKTAFAGLFLLFTSGGAIMSIIGITQALAKLSIVLFSSPITLAIGAVGVAGFLLWKNWDKIKEGLIITWGDTKDAAKSITTAIGQAFTDLWNLPRKAGEEFMTWMKGQLESMRGLAERARMFINPDYRPVSLPADVADLAVKYAGRYEIPAELIKRLIQAESGGNTRALSPKKAMGLMQLMPETAKRYGVTNAFDPAQNIAGGTAYLSYLLDRYKGNQALALAAYNAGEGSVDLYGGVPPFRETQAYVDKILGAGRNNISGQDIKAIAKEIQRGELLIRFDGAPTGMRVEPPRNTGGLNITPDVGYRSLGYGLP